MPSLESIVQSAYDETNNKLKTDSVTGTSNSGGVTSNLEGIVQACYDAVNNCLLVEE